MMPRNDDDNRREWLNDFRELAKRFEEEELQSSDNPYELIRIYVDATDIAIAVWDDASRPDGFGWLWVKGYDLVRGGLPPGQYRTLGIPCEDGNEAEEILAMFPEYDQQN